METAPTTSTRRRRPKTTGQGLIDHTSTAEEMLQLWAVRIEECHDSAADLDRYLIERARSRS